VSATHEVVFRRDQVLLIEDGGVRRKPVHIVHVKKNQICWADGPRGREQWESATAFIKRDPVVVGTVVRSFWRGASYDYDRRYQIEDNKERLERSEKERRAMVEAYGKANQAAADVEAIIEAIVKSAHRDEKNRGWVISDVLLAEHDVRGKARERLPR